MAKKKTDDSEAFALNLTSMIDVVFQLIIFFMCAMKFKTLEKKIEAFLPKDRGLAKTPEKIEEKVQIKVVLRQEPNEGVPHFYMFNEDVGRQPGDNNVARLGSPPMGKGVKATAIRAYEAKHKAFWGSHISPKLKLVEERIKELYEKDDTLPGQVDAGPHVRHEYVIAVLNAFMDAGMEEITFVGTPPPRPGS